VKADSFVAGKPRLASEKTIVGSFFTKSADLAPDGKRMVALIAASEAKGTPEAQNHLVFLETSSTGCGVKYPRASNCDGCPSLRIFNRYGTDAPSSRSCLWEPTKVTHIARIEVHNQ